MEISEPRIMVGNAIVKDHGTLQLQQTAENSFVFELPLRHTAHALLTGKGLAGKNICVWITANDGQKIFLVGTVHQATKIQSSYEEGQVILSGVLKKRIYALSLLTNYRLSLALAIVIPVAFISVLTYLFIEQKQHLVRQTGTVTAFTRRSRGARSPVIYKFQVEEFKAGFERSYEGFSRLAAENLSYKIYVSSSQSFPYSERKLKHGAQRQYSWYMDTADQNRLNTAGDFLPYIYLHPANGESNALFSYDIYTYIFDKHHLLTYLFLSFLSTLVFFALGAALQIDTSIYWKIYGGVVLIIYLVLFIF